MSTPLIDLPGLDALRRSAGAVRASLEIRPYAEADSADPWWVVCDFGSDARPGPLADDHVLGIGAASLTLAQTATALSRQHVSLLPVVRDLVSRGFPEPGAQS